MKTMLVCFVVVGLGVVGAANHLGVAPVHCPAGPRRGEC